MKSSRILFLFLGFSLIHFAYGLYQACKAHDDYIMCGDVCLKNEKTCHCGTSSFKALFYTDQTTTKVCCAPKGGCTKDANGDGHCKNGTIQEGGTVCNGLCPVAEGWKVSLPCRKIQQPGKIECSKKINPPAVCRGTPSSVCPNDTYLDEEYCMSQHTCHYKQNYFICPKLEELPSKHIQCQHRFQLLNNQYFHCIDRSDIGRSMFDRHVFRDAAPRLPLLSETLRFNQSGFNCTKDLFLKWTKSDLDRLYLSGASGDIQECLLKDNAKIDRSILFSLLMLDLSFKGRRYIPKTFLASKPYVTFYYM